MPRTCSVCRHADRERIDTDLIAGSPLRSIAAQYGTSATAVLRHKRQHLPQALVKAQDVREIAHGDALVGQMRDLNRRTLAILNRAERTGDGMLALKAIAEARRNHELLGKLLGDLGVSKTQAPTHVTFHQDRILNMNLASQAELEFMLASGESPTFAERQSIVARRIGIRQNGGDAETDAPLPQIQGRLAARIQKPEFR